MKFSRLKISRSFWCRFVLFLPFSFSFLFLLPQNQLSSGTETLLLMPLFGLPSYFVFVLGVLFWSRKQTPKQIISFWKHLPAFYVPVLLTFNSAFVLISSSTNKSPLTLSLFMQNFLFVGFLSIMIAIPYLYFYVALFYFLTKILERLKILGD